MAIGNMLHVHDDLTTVHDLEHKSLYIQDQHRSDGYEYIHQSQLQTSSLRQKSFMIYQSKFPIN